MLHVETVDRPSMGRPNDRISHLDALLGRSTVFTCGIGGGRDAGEMKASIHVVTIIYHGSVPVQSFVVVMWGGGIMVEIRKIEWTLA